MFFDYYYLILVIPALILASIAQVKIKTTYAKYSKIQNTRHLTGAQAAMMVLSNYGINNVRIEHVSGNLTDHYDPRTNVIRLSDSVYNGTSISAVGVACHEAGHAAQHAEGYLPIKIRNAIIPICNIGSAAGIPLALVGFFLSIGWLVDFGLILYSLIAVFQFATLPVEFNASMRAIRVIGESDILYDDEISGAKKVLRAAAMTYVASLVVALASLLRYVLIFNRRRD